MELSSVTNPWVKSYLETLLSTGLSSEHSGRARELGHELGHDETDKQICAKHYLQRVLNLDEEGTGQTWAKASAATPSPTEHEGSFRKEANWPQIYEFGDRSVGIVRSMQACLSAAGEGCEPVAVHSHYGDVGQAAAPMSHTLGCTLLPVTGHAPCCNKAEHLPEPSTPNSPPASTGTSNLEAVLAGTMADEPPIWKDILRFLSDPHRPVILAISQPDNKKNIITLVHAFGKHPALRHLANLVLIMGNRETIDSMSFDRREVLEQVLKLIDNYDLHGIVAYPKHHQKQDIHDIYLLASATQGVFVNIAVKDPFGLTLIEAAVHGLPIVATKTLRSIGILHTLRNGVLVEPTDVEAVGIAIMQILTSRETWDEYSHNGSNNMQAYSGPANCAHKVAESEAQAQQDRTDSFLFYSHSMVKLHSMLNCDAVGDQIVKEEGLASVHSDQPSAAGGRHPTFQTSTRTRDPMLATPDATGPLQRRSELKAVPTKSTSFNYTSMLDDVTWRGSWGRRRDLRPDFR